MRLVSSVIVVLGLTLAVAAARPFARGQAPGAPAQVPGGPGGGGGQGGARGPAPAPTNLKVLPKTWTRQQVQAVMQTFVTSLGQAAPAPGQPPAPAGQGEGCLHCHAPAVGAAPPPAGRGPTLDYALDTNPNKDIARKMITMVMAANDAMKGVGDPAVAEKVTCFTCHRGDATAKPATAPAAGWGRGSFTLMPAGPTVAAPGGGRGN